MYKTITNDELQQKRENEALNILDVREANEYTEFHIPGAENLPLSEIEQEFEKLDKNKHYHVHCKGGKRSVKACDFLTEKGFNLTNIEGGINAWKGEVTRG